MKATDRIFDTDKLATELRISPDEYEVLKKLVREEFPDDELMYELHLLRALRASIQKSPSTTQL